MKKLIYQGRIREGGVGTLTSEEYSVYFDDELSYAYLDPKPVVDYQDQSYRVSVNGSNDILRYHELHAEIQAAYFELIKPYLKKDLIVLEIGCGGGILLDKIRNAGFKTIGVEPNGEFQKSLRQNGHLVYSDVEEAMPEWQGKVGLVLSFHVIEHVHNPEDFIRSIGDLLSFGGRAFVQTPNYYDILLEINFDAFAPFFFRKVHPVYLTEDSLKKMVISSGLEFEMPVYYHDFGIANTFYWLRDKTPMGNQTMEGITPSLDEFWKEYLIKQKRTKDIAVVFSKKNI